MLLAVDDVDVKWCHHAFVIDLIASRRGKEIKLKLIAVLGGVKKTVVSLMLCEEHLSLARIFEIFSQARFGRPSLIENVIKHG